MIVTVLLDRISSGTERIKHMVSTDALPISSKANSSNGDAKDQAGPEISRLNPVFLPTRSVKRALIVAGREGLLGHIDLEKAA